LLFFSVLHVFAFPDLPNPGFNFKTFFCTWGGTTDKAFADFLASARPEIVQIGFYGPMFHGYADNPESTGYPMQLPVAGQIEAIAVQRKINHLVHNYGLKVIGHFQMVNVIVNDLHRYDFYDFYQNRWHDRLLGKKPTRNVEDLLQRDAEGKIITKQHYHIKYAGLCLSNPATRKMLKNMLRVAINSGVDGIITNYNYYWGCCCPHCQKSFKSFLRKRYSDRYLAVNFGIKNLEKYSFEKINAQIPGYPEKANKIDLAAMQWAATSFKEAFDDIIISYGRRLKPDLIVATWNHLGNMSISEERMFLPLKLWGRGENYFWYSGGYGPTDIKNGKYGDGWLNCLYIREMSGGKPFILGKYEAVRIRNSIAEGLATGGSGMGLYIRVKDPVAFDVAANYMNFIHKNRHLFVVDKPLSEAGLIFPRQSILQGDKQAMEIFKSTGEYLAEKKVFFDIICDEKLTEKRLYDYRIIICPVLSVLKNEQADLLADFIRKGGTICFVSKDSAVIINKNRQPVVVENPENMMEQNQELFDSLSRVEGTSTLRTSAFIKGKKKIIIHLVNYNRDEEKGKKLSGASDEYPIPARKLKIRLRIPPEARVKRISFLSPDTQKVSEIKGKNVNGTIEIDVDEVVVYGILEVLLK